TLCAAPAGLAGGSGECGRRRGRRKPVTAREVPWVEGLTFGQALARTAERFGGHDGLVFPHLASRRTYRELQADVHRAARALLALGVQRGEAVGVWATNWPQWVVTQFAAADAGAVLVNINPAYRAHELQYVLNQADITTLLLTDRFKASSFFDTLAGVCPELSACPPGGLRSAACPRLRWVVSIKHDKRPGMLNWDEFLGRGAAVPEAERERRHTEGTAEEVVNIQYTSG